MTTARAAAPQPPAESLPPLPSISPPTTRAVAAGFVMAVVMCGINSYLTLSFGVIEEGPTIAALFFFAVFFISKMKITTTEMVMVATMGSAGGSFGFIANFFAAKAMTGPAYSILQMIAFGIVSSLVGLVMVLPLRELLIRRTQLPWPGSKAVESVIRALVEHGDPRQAAYLFGTLALAFFYVVFNNEDGVGWFPGGIELGALAAVGGAISFSPFAIGGSYLMGFRTCVGFLVGAILLMVMAPNLPRPSAPHSFVWPGIGFLTASGLTLIAVNWRVTYESLASLVSLKPGAPDPERVLSGRTAAIFALVAFVSAILVLNLMFGISLLLVVVLIAVGGLIQNIIATRAQAQTAFNPARVMGILLEGVCWLFGGRATAINLTGAGFVAGSGAQAGNLTGDLAYGQWFRIPPRWQWLGQFSTVLPCTIVAAYVFDWIASQKAMTLETTAIAAPVAKVWAATSLIFDGSRPMPDGAIQAMLIAGGIAVVYTLIEEIPRLTRWVPSSVGIGLGLILPVAYGLSFFLGGFLFWIVLRRWFGVRDVTLTTLAVACIVAEGLGGVTKALLATIGVL